MEWKDIVRYHLSPPSGILPRSSGTQAKYESHQTNLRRAQTPIGCFIRDKYLGDRCWSFVLNEFPYEFSDGTRHYLLWFTEDFDESTTAATLSACGVNEYVCFENLLANRSIKDIRHLHVFTKDNGQPVSTRPAESC